MDDQGGGHTAKRRMSYDETMAWGARQWADITDRITRDHLGHATFTQTGGMCAAIEVALEDGYYLLVTDVDDTLSWDRTAHRGWYVGMYAPGEDSSDPLAFLEDDRGDCDTLLWLIGGVLRDGAAAIRRAEPSR